MEETGLIRRKDAIDVLCAKCFVNTPATCSTIQHGDTWCDEVYELLHVPSAQPEVLAHGEGELSAQPEPLSDAYMKAVWTWLSNYQIKAAELKGKYTPYEVLSWVVNDWRKEHGRSNQQTGGD